MTTTTSVAKNPDPNPGLPSSILQPHSIPPQQNPVNHDRPVFRQQYPVFVRRSAAVGVLVSRFSVQRCLAKATIRGWTSSYPHPAFFDLATDSVSTMACTQCFSGTTGTQSRELGSNRGRKKVLLFGKHDRPMELIVTAKQQELQL